MDINTLALAIDEIQKGTDTALVNLSTGSVISEVSAIYSGLLQIKGGLILLNGYLKAAIDEEKKEETTFRSCILRELSEPNVDGVIIDKNAFLLVDDSPQMVPLVFYPGHSNVRIPIGNAQIEKFANGELYVNLTIFPKDKPNK